MTPRPKLTLARAPRRAGPSLSMVKKAIRLYRTDNVPKAVWHANVRKWLRSMELLGDKHTLHRSNPPVRWGQPGEPDVRQVYAPRRLGGGL